MSSSEPARRSRSSRTSSRLRSAGPSSTSCTEKAFPRSGEIIDLGVDLGILKKSGSWFSYGERKIGQGRDSVKELLKSDEALRDEIEAKVRAGLAAAD